MRSSVRIVNYTWHINTRGTRICEECTPEANSALYGGATNWVLAKLLQIDMYYRHDIVYGVASITTRDRIQKMGRQKVLLIFHVLGAEVGGNVHFVKSWREGRVYFV